MEEQHSKLVGRGTEFEVLEGALGTVEHGPAGIVQIAGEQGIGKTSLIAATYAALRRGKPTWPVPSDLARSDDLVQALWTDSARLVGLPGRARSQQRLAGTANGLWGRLVEVIGEVGPHAGEKVPERKRLRDEIVGAELEAPSTVLIVASGSQDDDRNLMAGLSYPPENFHPVDIGKAEVQDYERHIGPGCAF